MDPILAEIRRLDEGGRVIEAIKLARERYGMGLKEAKDFVEGLRTGRVTPPAAVASPVASSFADADGVRAAVVELLLNGQKIQAIKLLRETFGMGLKEAKDLADSIEPAR